jgi:hypothetical protein
MEFRVTVFVLESNGDAVTVPWSSPPSSWVGSRGVAEVVEEGGWELCWLWRECAEVCVCAEGPEQSLSLQE